MVLDYHRLARTERYRWWTPIRELVSCVLFVILLWAGAVLPVAFAVGPASDGVAGLILLGVATAVAIPASVLAARTTRGRWRPLLSVDGVVRWRWLRLCLAVALVEGLLSVVAEAVFAALGAPLGPPRGAWVGWARFLPLALAVVVAIPPQAAAEEILFRGTLMQALGAWVRAPWFAVLLSSVAFGAMHALPLPGFVSTSTFGLVCAWLTIRTGGLEAAVALHVLHNSAFFLAEAATGRGDRWITETNVDVHWHAALVDIGLSGLYGVAIAILDTRRGREARCLSRQPAQPDDLQLGEGGHHHGLQQDEGHAKAAGIDPAGEEQRHAVHGPERVARDDGPDHAARHDVAAPEHRDEGRIG
jgi:membrane protease YdiL (CAAX protease family)